MDGDLGGFLGVWPPARQQRGALAADLGIQIDVKRHLDAHEDLEETALLEKVQEDVDRFFREKEATMGSEFMRAVEKHFLLRVLDTQWRDHLANMDYLRQGIHLRGYAQKQPKQEYKREAFELFTQMLDRVKQELEYIAERVPLGTPGLEISDLNFGMYRRDAEICDSIRQIQDRYGWPKHITTSTGKNRKERVVEAVGRLNGTLRLTMSVQSTDPEVLTAKPGQKVRRQMDVRAFDQKNPEIARQVSLLGITLVEPSRSEERQPRVAALAACCNTRTKIGEKRRQSRYVQPFGKAADDLGSGQPVLKRITCSGR